MTEKEAIKILRNIQNAKKVEYEDAACAAAWFSIFKYVYPEPEDYVIEEAIKALEEIQQYREIGTLEELKTASQYIRLAKLYGTIGKVIDQCVAYEEIGTVEECREAVEKQKAKKPFRGRVINGNEYEICRKCTAIVKDEEWKAKYCPVCGQAIDWSEEE